jgi:type IV pilus assembly protein PilC
MARFSHTLGMLVGAGVPIVEGVQIVSTVINNTIIEDTLKKVSHQLERGISMSTPISEAKEFPPIVYQMIEVGEQTGKLDETMNSLSTYFEEETSSKVKALSSVIEPLLIVIVGIGVGIMVFAIVVPIYQISLTIQ